MRAFLATLAACGCVLSAPAWAARPVRVYEVDVDGQSAAATQDAMRQALVRATGRRESAFTRGLDHQEQRSVPEILALIKKHEFAVRSRRSVCYGRCWRRSWRDSLDY